MGTWGYYLYYNKAKLFYPMCQNSSQSTSSYPRCNFMRFLSFYVLLNVSNLLKCLGGHSNFKLHLSLSPTEKPFCFSIPSSISFILSKP
ncbi:hypothetical protein HanPSC8_Chr06g0235281 [Helianthus annuus]|nr:hypothetical protein HanPSC8_Chr06g0235281 [Helianthus annuus]